MFNTYLNRKHSVIPKRVSWSIIKSIWLNITDKGHVFTLINIYIRKVTCPQIFCFIQEIKLRPLLM